MQNAEQEIEKLQSIIHQYTTFFIVFDIVFFVTIILIILFAIQMLKSRKKLRSSNRYLRFTIKGQEEERARIARGFTIRLPRTCAIAAIYQKKLMIKMMPSWAKGFPPCWKNLCPM